MFVPQTLEIFRLGCVHGFETVQSADQWFLAGVTRPLHRGPTSYDASANSTEGLFCLLFPWIHEAATPHSSTQILKKSEFSD